MNVRSLNLKKAHVSYGNNAVFIAFGFLITFEVLLLSITNVSLFDPLYLQSEQASETLRWLNILRHNMRGLGSWRQRRNALPNIMMHHTSCDV